MFEVLKILSYEREANVFGLKQENTMPFLYPGERSERLMALEVREELTLIFFSKNDLQISRKEAVKKLAKNL